MKFDELKLDGQILAAVENVGFEECTEVQARAIPPLLERRDVMVQSQTGTGKTAAFLLPAFQLLLHDENYAGSTALIVAPTRELAVQIKEEADMLSENLPIRAEVFHGGVGYGQQEQALSDGVNIIVGTPGRILDLSQTGTMRLKEVKIMVIDEADRLFDMGFYPDIRKMMRRMVPREERVTMLFSATLSTRVRNIAWEYMNNPVEIEVEPEQITVDKVQQTLYHVSSQEKLSVMLGLLNEIKPRTAIVFTNTKRAAEEIAKRLEINGYPAEYIMGDLPQRKRIAIIRKIKAGEAEYLVATDVAARGLHIDNLEMVINYDLPEDPEAYVHRIGRTARAGESGRAISLACERFVFGLEAIEKLINQKIPVRELTPDLFAEDASAGTRIRFDRDGADDRGRGSDRGRSRDGGRGRSDRPRSDRPRSDRPRSDRPRNDRPRREERPVREGDSRRSEERRRRPAPRPADAHHSPKAGDALEERLAYYRSKYGEDFQPTDEMLASMQSGGGRDGEAGRKPRKRRRRSPRPAQAGGTQERGSGKSREAAPRTEATSAPRERAVPKNTAPPTPAAPAPAAEGLIGRIKSIFGKKK